jgi:hypothetical protein
LLEFLATREQVDPDGGFSCVCIFGQTIGGIEGLNGFDFVQ